MGINCTGHNWMIHKGRQPDSDRKEEPYTSRITRTGEETEPIETMKIQRRRGEHGSGIRHPEEKEKFNSQI